MLLVSVAVFVVVYPVYVVVEPVFAVVYKGSSTIQLVLFLVMACHTIYIMFFCLCIKIYIKSMQDNKISALLSHF